MTDETAENVRAVQAKGELGDEKLVKELLKRKLIQSR